MVEGLLVLTIYAILYLNIIELLEQCDSRSNA